MPTPSTTNRRTISSPTPTFKGLGLFSGAVCSVTIRPSPSPTGILLTTPGRGPVTIGPLRIMNDWTPAKWPDGVPVRNTAIRAGGQPVGTVEHVLSALAGLGITDAVIDSLGPEFPILDGSSLPFTQALAPLITDLEQTTTPILLKEEMELSDGSGASILASPRQSPGCTFTYELDYGPASCIPEQSATWHGDPADYTLNIAPARTFSFRREAEAAQAMGLFKNFSTSDMVVIGDNGQPIDGQWRLDNEPARHKLLDLIGDLSLLGRPLQANVVATKSGHRLTHELCREIQRMLSI